MNKERELKENDRLRMNKPDIILKIGNKAVKVPRWYHYDGVNTLALDLGIIKLYYSYDTIIAFETETDGLVVSENIWSVTTGRHINTVDYGDKARRIERNDFEARLAIALAEFIGWHEINV